MNTRDLDVFCFFSHAWLLGHATFPVQINVTIQAKDQYGNFLTAGGETTWALLLKTTPPEYLGQTSAGTVYDLGNGTYSGVYRGTINGILLMQVLPCHWCCARA